MNIGLFGGAFDPVHIEHQKFAKRAIWQLKLDKLIIIPTRTPPHKELPSTDGKHRLAMLKIAFEGMNNVFVSDFELSRSETNFSYITIGHFKEEFPNSKLFFLMGGDSLIDFFKWKNTKYIVENSTIVVEMRDGFLGYDHAVKEFTEKFLKNPVEISEKGGDLSSTELRTLLEFGINLDDKISSKVIEYIRSNSLYRTHFALIEKVKAQLLERRFLHTAYTTAMAQTLAKAAGCDAQKAFIAAALHDIAKHLIPSELKDLGFENKQNLPDKVIHSYAGALLAQKNFGITDEDILNSIRYHTTGRPGMSQLEKLIYVSDCIEKMRTFDGVEKLRQTTFSDFEKGFVACLKYTNDLLKTRTEVNNLTQVALDYYIRG